ncbi:hypothetical protein ACWNS2_00135 [Planococcus plakortidis]
MNSYEKKKAQIEQKRLQKRYGIWVCPLSDFGKSVLKKAEGIYLHYNVYYDDPAETEEQRIESAKDVARAALAYQYDEYFRHHNVTTRSFKIGLLNVSKNNNRIMQEGKDYEMQVNAEEVNVPAPLTFEDIKAL